MSIFWIKGLLTLITFSAWLILGGGGGGFILLSWKCVSTKCSLIQSDSSCLNWVRKVNPLSWPWFSTHLDTMSALKCWEKSAIGVVEGLRHRGLESIQTSCVLLVGTFPCSGIRSILSSMTGRNGEEHFLAAGDMAPLVSILDPPRLFEDRESNDSDDDLKDGTPSPSVPLPSDCWR